MYCTVHTYLYIYKYCMYNAEAGYPDSRAHFTLKVPRCQQTSALGKNLEAPKPKRPRKLSTQPLTFRSERKSPYAANIKNGSTSS